MNMGMAIYKPKPSTSPRTDPSLNPRLFRRNQLCQHLNHIFLGTTTRRILTVVIVRTSSASHMLFDICLFKKALAEQLSVLSPVLIFRYRWGAHHIKWHYHHSNDKSNIPALCQGMRTLIGKYINWQHLVWDVMAREFSDMVPCLVL